MEFVGETRSVSRPGTDAERINPAETTDPESSATVNPQQPDTGPAHEEQQAVGAVALQPGPSNTVHETHTTVAQHAELHLPEAAAQQSAGTETLQPAVTVSVLPGPSEVSETMVQTFVPEEEQIMTTGWLDPVAQHLPSAGRGTVGLPAGQQGLTGAVRRNLSLRTQPVIPTIEPGLPVQGVGGIEGYLVEPEEPEHPQQPLQDYIIVFASQPSKIIICSYTTDSSCFQIH